MARVAWVITIVDNQPTWRRSAAELVRSGVPLPTVLRWAAERRVITSDLKRRVREAVN